ncbi:hypothetical protein ACRCRN_34140 [Pseudomonas aeruginosa]
MKPSVFHITPSENVPSILANGLTPQIGPRSIACNEREPRTFFFTSVTAAETALCSWLGEELEDCPSLSLLLVDPHQIALNPDAGYEVYCTLPVPPEQITLLVGPTLLAPGYESLRWIAHNDVTQPEIAA